MTATQYHTRWMIRRDMDYVLAIEEACFPCAWTAQDFKQVLGGRYSIGMIVEHPNSKVDRPIGYMIYELHKTRLHLLNFAVHPDHWRQGVGTALVDKLKSKLSPERRTSLTLEVRETNVAAQCFFRAVGFKATQVLREFYFDTDEDAYFMEYRT